MRQYKKTVEDISEDQLEQTFRINIFSQFYIVKHALPHMQTGSCGIINTASVTAYKGKPELIDYSSTKGCDCVVHEKFIPTAQGQRNKG